MKAFIVFASVLVLSLMHGANADETTQRSFDEVRVCLKDLSKINDDNKKSEDILEEALFENLYRALACVEVLSDLEKMEITASQEKELQDWQEQMEKDEKVEEGK